MDAVLPKTASSWIDIARITKTPLDLEFLTDPTAKLNKQDSNVAHKISAVSAFKVTLYLWLSQLGNLAHFSGPVERLSHIFVHLDI